MLPRKRKVRPTTKSLESVAQKRQRRESAHEKHNESTVMVRRYEDEIKRIYSGANVISPAEIARTICQKHKLNPDVLTPTMVRNKIAYMIKKGVLRKRTTSKGNTRAHSRNSGRGTGYEQARQLAEQREVDEISESDDEDSGAESQDEEEDGARCGYTNMLMETGELYMTEDPDNNCLFVYIKLYPDAKLDFVNYSKSELEFVVKQAGVATSAIEARFTANKVGWGPRQLTGVIVPPDGQVFDDKSDIGLKVVDLNGREVTKDPPASECSRWVTVRLKFEQLGEFTAVSGL